MLLNSTNITHQRSNHIIATSCSSIPVTRQSPRSSSAESPPDAPKSPFRAEIDTRHMESPCPVSPPSGGSSNWSSPSTCIFSSPLRPEEPCGVSSKITFDLGEMIDEAFFCSLLPPKPRLSVDVSSYKHILGEVEEEEAPHYTPLTAPRYTPDYPKVVDAQGSADPAAVENPIIRCLPDLHLLQTPLREAFREVFDYLSDETPDYAEQQTQHPYGTVNCTRGNLAAPLLSCDSTDLNSNISESDGKSSAALNPRPESCLPSLENGPPLIPLPTPPCNLKRRPAGVNRSTREKRSASQLMDSCAQSKASTRPKALLSGSFVFDRAFIRQTRHFKYWNAILEGPPLLRSSKFG